MEKKPLTLQELTKEIKKILACFPISELTQPVAIHALQVVNTFVADSPKAALDESFVGRGMDLDDLKSLASDPEVPIVKHKAPIGSYDDPPF